MKPRTVWTVLRSCLLGFVNLFFAVAIFVALVYALAVLGYWYADVFLFDLGGQ